MDRTLLDRPALARRLGVTVEWLYRNLRLLEAQGFPRPVFGNMNGARWDPLAIDRWLDKKMDMAPQPLPAPTIDADFRRVDNEDDWAERMDARVARIVAEVE